MDKKTYPLRMVAWELTRNCNLDCLHCRARAGAGPFDNELSFDECARIIDDIAAFSSPTIIFTGGEPLLRPDIYPIIEYASSKGLRTVIALNGTLVTPGVAHKLKEAGILRVSMSIDGKDRETHDAFRRVSGSFDAVMRSASHFPQRRSPISDQYYGDAPQFSGPGRHIRARPGNRRGGLAHFSSRSRGEGRRPQR